jgi:hypothetical protein
MFFLFGWGHQTTKDYGPAIPIVCPNCHNEGYWHLLHVRVWFTLFFIPLIPYESNHYLLCEICSRGMELSGEQVTKAKELSEATAAYLSKTMTEEVYASILHAKRLTA